MGKIILIGNEKGGVGKSTIAVNIAVWRKRIGQDVIIVDTDKQQTTSNFITGRSLTDLPKIPCVQKNGDVYDTLIELSKRYEEVIVDAGGQDSIELRSALSAANILLMPLKASQIDLWAADRMNSLIKMAKTHNRNLETFAVISMAPTNPHISETNDAKELIADYENLNLLNIFIRERKIYRDAFVEGKGVVEMNNQKASDEIINLGKEIFNGKILKAA